MSMTGTGIVAAAVAAAAIGGAQQPESRPIDLRVARNGEMLTLTVVGNAPTAVEARYALQVSSDVRGGGNRSTQRGSVRLQPGKPVTLIALSVGNARDGNWQAVLDVEPSTGAAYRIERRAVD